MNGVALRRRLAKRLVPKAMVLAILKAVGPSGLSSSPLCLRRHPHLGR
jgi:hypothetical protein